MIFNRLTRVNYLNFESTWNKVLGVVSPAFLLCVLTESALCINVVSLKEPLKQTNSFKHCRINAQEIINSLFKRRNGLPETMQDTVVSL